MVYKKNRYFQKKIPFIANESKDVINKGANIHSAFIFISATLISLSSDNPVLKIAPIYITIISPIKPYLGIKNITRTTLIKESIIL